MCIRDIVNFPVFIRGNHHHKIIRSGLQFRQGRLHGLGISFVNQNLRSSKGILISLLTGFGISLGYLIRPNLPNHVLQAAANHQIPFHHGPGMAVICYQPSCHFPRCINGKLHFSVCPGIILVQYHPGCHRIIVKVKGFQRNLILCTCQKIVCAYALLLHGKHRLAVGKTYNLRRCILLPCLNIINIRRPSAYHQIYIGRAVRHL